MNELQCKVIFVLASLAVTMISGKIYSQSISIRYWCVIFIYLPLWRGIAKKCIALVINFYHENLCPWHQKKFAQTMKMKKWIWSYVTLWWSETQNWIAFWNDFTLFRWRWRCTKNWNIFDFKNGMKIESFSRIKFLLIVKWEFRKWSWWK